MGLFGTYVYKKKDGTKFWLHMKQRGKVVLYYFSKDPRDAINLPRGYEVVENSKAFLPFLKKKEGGFFGAGKKKHEKKEAAAQGP